MWVGEGTLGMADSHVATPLRPAPTYSGKVGRVRWEGLILDPSTVSYLKSGVLRDRLRDSELINSMKDDLKELDERAQEAQRLVADASVAALLVEGRSDIEPEQDDDAASAFSMDSLSPHQAELLSETPRQYMPWRIGEVIAEILLAEWHSAVWVWNGDRDLKDPNASLPGADLAGFIVEPDGSARFLFGEVKTSSEDKSPPGLMSGRNGLIKQLEDLGANPRYSVVLVKWLRSRIQKGSESFALYQSALSNFWKRPEALVLVGCLVRDTEPNEKDVLNRAAALASTVPSDEIALHVWHVPDAIDSLPSYLDSADE